ncbi:MAG TPA: HD domain-containing phosphohydrolase, partial [Phycisphaerales bacterium]|nr:HD domain-containing phosphohydrolase [Phycisphaerales bacterium]
DTGNHILRIRAIVQAIAEQMGFATADAEALGYDAMLHDVGKLTTPHTILKKPDHLTDDERRVMEAHTIRGETLLGERASMQRAARIARWHHESWDGTGYPDGLHGSEIPIEARITAAADLLDALISTRCYKQAWTYEDAFQEVIRLSGTKLDPTVVTAIELCNRSGVLCQIFGLAPRCAMG